MQEWVLIFALHIAGNPGEIRDVSTSMLGGFRSQASCEAAAKQLAMRTISLVGRARMQQGIQGNSGRSTPAINSECVLIVK